VETQAAPTISLAPHAQVIYDPIFAALGQDLPTIVPQLGTVDSMTASLSTAQIVVLRTVAGGTQAFFVNVFRAGDGIWRIESM
jgi:hypothetical protein